MLSLIRKHNEIIRIGDNIRIRIKFIGKKQNKNRYRQDQVKILIDAPLSIPVHREEIHRRIQYEKMIENQKGIKIYYKKSRHFKGIKENG